MRNVMEGVLFTIAVVGFITGIYKGRKAWQKARDEAIAARTRQEDGIARVLKHMDNGGSMLVEKVDKGNAMITQHIADADGWFKSNDEAHKEIHRRIDGLVEAILGGSATAPRKAAERHRGRCE